MVVATSIFDLETRRIRQRRFYELTPGSHCPKCGIGMILRSWRAKVCICCGLRVDDETSTEDMMQDAIIFWCLRNQPHELDHEPGQKQIHAMKGVANG